MPSRFGIGQQIKPSRTGWAQYPSLKLKPTRNTRPAPAFRGTAHAAAAPASNPAFAQWTPQQIAQVMGKYAPAYSGPSSQEINQTALKFRNTLPAALSNQQIQSRAQASIDPVIDKITAAINARVAGSQKAVTGYTNQLANNLAANARTLSDPYNQSAERSAAVTQALSDRLAAGGQASGQDLATRLQAVGGPAAEQQVAATQAAGGASGNALFASGSSDVQELLKNAASAQSYGNKLPGIARLGGQQQIGLIGQQGVTDTAEQVAAAQGQLPTIVQNLRSMSEDRSSNRASLYDRMFEYLTSQGVEGRANAQSNAADLYTTLLGQNVTRAGLAAGYDEKAAAASAPIIDTFGNGGVQTIDPRTGKVTVTNQPTVEPTPAPEVKTEVVGDYKSGRKLINSATGEVIKVISPPHPGTATTATTKANGGLSPSSMRILKSEATTLANTLAAPSGVQYYQGHPVEGSGRDPVPYAQALQQVIGLGNASSPAWVKQATNIVNGAYPMGENGRAYTGAAAVAEAIQFAKEARDAGLSAAEAANRAVATGVLPDAAIKKAILTVFPQTSGATTTAPTRTSQGATKPKPSTKKPSVNFFRPPTPSPFPAGQSHQGLFG